MVAESFEYHSDEVKSKAKQKNDANKTKQKKATSRNEQRKREEAKIEVYKTFVGAQKEMNKTR